MLNKEKFAGDKKVGLSLLGALEKRFVNKHVDKIPHYIETYHLTLMTLIWSFLIVISGFLAARYNMHWLWLSSICIVLQYFTDLFDGAVGRYRNTGLIKWGYYMDHFLDYIFLCSILISYSFIVPMNYDFILFSTLAVLAGYMMNAYLSFAATNEFRISYLKIGPTEVRIVFVIVNTFFIIFEKAYLYIALPASLIFCSIGLLVVVYRTHKELWKMDMEAKKQRNQS